MVNISSDVKISYSSLTIWWVGDLGDEFSEAPSYKPGEEWFGYMAYWAGGVDEFRKDSMDIMISGPRSSVQRSVKLVTDGLKCFGFLILELTDFAGWTRDYSYIYKSVAVQARWCYMPFPLYSLWIRDLFAPMRVRTAYDLICLVNNLERDATFKIKMAR